MKLHEVQLENFRNYRKYRHEFVDGKSTTVLTGDNAIGKTNLLEAIFFLSLGKSFRTSAHENLIFFGENYFRIKAILELDEGEKISLEAYYEALPRKRKILKINGLSTSAVKYIGSLITVLFHPEDLNMLYLSPGLRRKYLNILLCQVDRDYLTALSKYEKILRQRRALLKEIPHKTGLIKDLDHWDENMLAPAVLITEKRQDFINFLNGRLENIYQSVSGKKERIKVAYKNFSKQENAENLADLFMQTLKAKREKELLIGKNLCGPHLDDISFFIDEKEINSAASRGEFRTLMVALKIAEIEFIKQVSGKTPILLLDDVLSELDESRQRALLHAIKDCQVVITTTELTDNEENALNKGTIEVVSLK